MEAIDKECWSCQLGEFRLMIPVQLAALTNFVLEPHWHLHDFAYSSFTVLQQL